MRSPIDFPVFTADNPDFRDFEIELDQANVDQQFEFEQALIPMPETDQFKAEMDSPIRILDDDTGITYGVWQVNRDYPGKPLVLNMSWSVAAGVKPGRQEVKAYADHFSRPITVIDMEAHGETDIPSRSWRKDITFDKIAAAHLRIIDRLGIGKFDIEGLSMGGLIAAKIAEQAGGRVANLVTVSTVSFDAMKKLELGIGFAIREAKHQKRYVKEAPPAIQDEAGVGFVGTLRSVPTLLRLASMMTAQVMPQTVDKLSPDTKWYDFVGSMEEVTDWRDHLYAVRQRNQAHPRSSSVYVLGQETHSWSTHINAVATAVASVLQK